MSSSPPTRPPTGATVRFRNREWKVLYYVGNVATLGIGKVFKRKDKPPTATETTTAWVDEMQEVV